MRMTEIRKGCNHEHCAMGCREAKRRVIELEAELKKHDWVAVEDGLPEEKGLYILGKDFHSEDVYLDIKDLEVFGSDALERYIKHHDITHYKLIILLEGV